MATPKIIADFESSLATALAVGGTSFTLSSATDDDGVALPAGLYYFTVDNGSNQKEYLAGTLAGTSVTGVLSVSRQGIETSGAARAHRVGASVIMTDFATYKNYMDEIALVSAPDAGLSAKGVVETATLAEVRARTATGGTGAALAITPNVMDDLPTQAEKAALAGGATFGTPSGANKFITQDYNASATGLPVVRTYLNAASPATWTKPAGLKYVVVEVQAVGGNGSTATTTNMKAAGGGGGGYGKKAIAAAALGATETVTIGAVGANSSFGSHVTSVAGGSATADSASGFGSGGTSSGGDISIQGQPGQVGSGTGTTTGLLSGSGGDSFLGRGGHGVSNNVGGTGSIGSGFGGGGAGGCAFDATDQSGGAAAPAIVIVTEYYS